MRTGLLLYLAANTMVGMTDFRMRVAGLDIAVRSMYDQIHRQCAGYLIPSLGFDEDLRRADLAIEISQADIDHERTMSDSANWRDDYLETLAVFRRIAEYAPEHHRMVFHGATIEVDGRAYIFTAPSGTGKSTHIALWRRAFGQDVAIINGDKPMLRIVERNTAGRGAGGDLGSVLAYGTPWAGKENWQRNTSAPLAGICVVTRADADRMRGPVPVGGSSAVLRQPTAVQSAVSADISPLFPPSSERHALEPTESVSFSDDEGIPNVCMRLSAAEALPLVARQTYLPASPTAAVCTLGLLDELLAAVPVYRLSCTISEAAVRASSAAMLM